MENDRVRMIEVHIKAHSKVNVDSPANRERFLYMLSDGALVLAPPGKTPYELACQQTAVFPAVSPAGGKRYQFGRARADGRDRAPMRTEVASEPEAGQVRRQGQVAHHGRDAIEGQDQTGYGKPRIEEFRQGEFFKGKCPEDDCGEHGTDIEHCQGESAAQPQQGQRQAEEGQRQEQRLEQLARRSYGAALAPRVVERNDAARRGLLEPREPRQRAIEILH